MAALPQSLETSRGWCIGGRVIDLRRPLIMGVINVTPDSFSDGGRFADLAAARAHAEQMILEGADLIDVGGESTRPGAAEVSATEEIDRVVPLIESIAASGVPVSIDTSKPQVMRAALAAGAAIVNDVSALREPGAIDAVHNSDCGVVLMHMKGTPRTMQQAPVYDDVVGEVASFLGERVDAVVRAGVDRRRIAIDPGFGFGKSVAHNFALLDGLDAIARRGLPVLVGLSRKSMLGAVTGRAVGERLFASVAAAVIAVERGADIVRVHDVAATRDALSVWQAARFAKESA